MVQDVLTLDQGFVDAALDPQVKSTLTEYIGPSFALVEAKGWLSLPTNEDFHGWHGDGWYDQERVTGLQREVKLALYLTDVRSGAFNYIKGTHGKLQSQVVQPRRRRQARSRAHRPGRRPAGTAILSTPAACTARACRFSSRAMRSSQLIRSGRAAAPGRHHVQPLPSPAAQRGVPG